MPEQVVLKHEPCKKRSRARGRDAIGDTPKLRLVALDSHPARSEGIEVSDSGMDRYAYQGGVRYVLDGDATMSNIGCKAVMKSVFGS